MRHIRNMYGSFMQRCRGKLYTHITIRHTEYGLAEFQYGENPSAHKPNRTFRRSTANEVCIQSKCFHTAASEGWVRTPSCVA